MHSRPDHTPSSRLRLHKRNILALGLRLVALLHSLLLAAPRLGWQGLDLLIPEAQLNVSVLPHSAVLPPPAFILLWEEAVVSDLLVLWVVV
jgi:hypothetical protein